jgi:hypothetical protein
MAWDVEYTDEFEQWWHSLTEKEQVVLDASVRLLEIFGMNSMFQWRMICTMSTFQGWKRRT